MSDIKKNILANLLGRGWSSLIFIVFTPIYLKLLGIEAYGLIGFFSTLQSVLFLLDLGLNATLTRELARSGTSPEEKRRARDMLRTLEIVYWVLAALMMILLLIGAPLIADHWLNPHGFTHHELSKILVLMGIALAVQFPNNLYIGGLFGLQRQVLCNAVASIFVTIRFGGAALLLWLYSPSLEAFFIWHAVLAFVQSLLTGAILWRSFAKPAVKASFSFALLREVMSFAAGMAGIGILNTLFSQADKLILSKLVSLEYFGYYMLAATVATGLYQFMNPIYNAIFPRLSQYIRTNDGHGIRALYHGGCQVVSIIIVPIVAVVSLFSSDILLVWTGSPIMAGEVHLLLSVMVVSILLNSMMSIPLALQLAYGWTTLALRLRLGALLLLGPALYVLTSMYGVIGAAIALVLIESLYLVVGIIVMHRRLLTGDLYRWTLQDVLLPSCVAISVALLGRFLIKMDITSVADKFMMVGLMAVVTAIAMLAAGLQAPYIRSWVIGKIRSFGAA